MNVTCTGCPAKYAVPDEKVRGKKVRIACKHCGTNIIVDGTALGTEEREQPKPIAAALAHAATPSVPEPLSARATDSEAAQSQPLAEVSFLVGFSDERQESRTLSQIVDMYQNRQLDDEGLVWKDGMVDWLSPFDVPEIAAAMQFRGVIRRVARPVPQLDDEATLVVRSPLEDHELALARAQAEARSSAAAATPKPVVAAAVPASAAARRTERRAAAVDLFGHVAGAGSEQDASLHFGATDEPAPKLTGARNESSVLFSLDALTRGDAKANQSQKARDKEQEKRASAALFGDSAPDSLLNMGGGGLSALAAPDFTKPVPEIVEPIGQGDPELDESPAHAKKRGGLGLFLALLALGAVASAAFVMKRNRLLPESAATAPPAPTVAVSAAATQPSSAPPPAASLSPEPRASAAAASARPVASSEATASAPSLATAKSVPAAAPIAAAAPSAASRPAEPPATTAKPVESAASTATPAEPTAAADGPAFDKGAAVTALGAAAANAASCKSPDGPTGTGKVSVTFAPSGRATATNVVGALAGTEVGGCVARLFRAARVPAFSGDPVTVSKSFSIQ
jgi:predicted Zn finger-like uncharacterized protein